MNREEIRTVVITKLTHAVEGLNAESIDTKRSMADFGANSLDIVEVVSASMRELKVKVPRAELSNISNIDGLVDLLLRVSQQDGAGRA